jgi:3-deoxy-D-manno-octulosonate 8-phosphate phosphatase KdsC-like HAD superfamily phosphatase
MTPRRRLPTNSQLIKLVAIDVDGCLSEGECRPLDLELLRYFGELNELSKSDPMVPAITHITGRSAQYMEVLIQLTRGYMPAIYESGAAALLPQNYRFLYSPYLKPHSLRNMRHARGLIADELEEKGLAFVQPGLELTLSAYPIEPFTMEQLYEQIILIFAPYRDDVIVEQTRTCVDVMPVGSGKAYGLRWLSELSSTPFTAMAGFGDSGNDLAFLDLVAYSGAPSNAVAETKESVKYLSPYSNGRGVRDFLEQCLRINKEMMERH